MKPNNFTPCPFCGCKDIISEINIPGRIIRIHCDLCPASVVMDFDELDLGDGEYMSFEEVTEAMNTVTDRWNRRDTRNQWMSITEIK